MAKSKIAIIGLVALLALSLGGNIFQFIQLRTANEQIAASTIKTDKLSAKIAEQETTISNQAAEIEQLKKELAEQAALIEKLNTQKQAAQTDGWGIDPATGKMVQNPNYNPDAPIDTPLPGDMLPPASKPETPASKPETPASKPETPAAKPKPPANKPADDNGGREPGVPAGPNGAFENVTGGSGSTYNPNEEGLLRPHGE